MVPADPFPPVGGAGRGGGSLRDVYALCGRVSDGCAAWLRDRRSAAADGRFALHRLSDDNHKSSHSVLERSVASNRLFSSALVRALRETQASSAPAL